MKIFEDRFKSILAGTATNLTSKEILIRQQAFDAERRGQEQMLAVEAQMPDVTIVRREADRRTVPPLSSRAVGSDCVTHDIVADVTQKRLNAKSLPPCRPARRARRKPSPSSVVSQTRTFSPELVAFS
jgi:hypothetical protein